MIGCALNRASQTSERIDSFGSTLRHISSTTRTCKFPYHMSCAYTHLREREGGREGGEGEEGGREGGEGGREGGEGG